MKHFRLFFLLAMGTLLSAPFAWAENISGTYVSNYAGTAIILQIVQVSGSQIQGRAEQVTMTANGQKLDTQNFSVTGATSGETIVLSLKDAYSGSIIPMSGTLNGGDMQISGGRPDGSGTFTWILHRSSQSVFDRQVATLSATANAGANAAASAKQLQDQVKEAARHLDVETQSKKSFDDYCVYTTKIEFKLKKIRDDFRKITGAMKEKLKKQRITPPNSSQNGFERNQILYSINDDFYNSNDIGYNLNDLSLDAHYANGTIDIRSNLGYAMKQDAFHGCGNGSTGFCALVNQAFNRADQCNTDLIAAFQKTYTVQNQERAKQVAIKQEAARLANLHP